ncbi:hypothetical protein PENSPDRAFT_657887 [Peniophora sp. CONT]|nr:hypothetical protein PENSPDRAFT_657887 [Peniophora sp. CONT]
MSMIPPGHILRLPEHASEITDADEEIFLLYTRLATLKPTDEDTTSLHGLGFVDSSLDKLPIRLEIKPRTAVEADTVLGGRKKRKTRISHMVLEWELWQDKTALRSRAGDTGSVLWQASVDFAAFVLQQRYFPYPESLFDIPQLSSARVVELGAGTGLLGAALGPLFAQYTATDIPALVPLLQKNLTDAKGDVSACALDWTFPVARQLPDDLLREPLDLVLAVDCIYNPSLVPPLLNTISQLCAPNHTVVLVVSELRSEDVMREFVEGWLQREVEGWRIHSVNGEGEGCLLGARYAMWVGWRTK